MKYGKESGSNINPSLSYLLWFICIETSTPRARIPCRSALLASAGSARTPRSPHAHHVREPKLIYFNLFSLFLILTDSDSYRSRNSEIVHNKSLVSRKIRDIAIGLGAL